MPRCKRCKHEGDRHIEVHISDDLPFPDPDAVDDDVIFLCNVVFCSCPDYDPEFIERLN